MNDVKNNKTPAVYGNALYNVVIPLYADIDTEYQSDEYIKLPYRTQDSISIQMLLLSKPEMKFSECLVALEYLLELQSRIYGG